MASSNLGMQDLATHDCPAGQMWYVCNTAKSDFTGCCSKDPCDIVGCPDDKLTSKTSSTKTSRPTRSAVHPTSTDEDTYITTIRGPTASGTAIPSTDPTAGAPGSSATPSGETDDHSNHVARIGIAVGVTLGVVLMVAALIAIFVMRHRRKRAQSPLFPVRGREEDDFHPRTDDTGAGDVFAPFGGRTSSPNSQKPQDPIMSAKSAAESNNRWSMMPIVSPVSPRGSVSARSFGGTNVVDQTIVEEKPNEPVQLDSQAIFPDEPIQLDSQAIYPELDSAGTEKKMSELPTPISAQSAFNSESEPTTTAQTSPLTPGLPGGTVGTSGDRSNDLTVEKVLTDQSGHDSSWTKPSLRATLNPTEADRANNRHVTSWNQL